MENRSITNLFSKKLITTESTIAAILFLAKDAPNKLPYCMLIVGIVVVYKICQTILDKKREA